MWPCLEELLVVTAERVEDPAGQVQEFYSTSYSAQDPSTPLPHPHTAKNHLAPKAEKLWSRTSFSLHALREQNRNDRWK